MNIEAKNFEIEMSNTELWNTAFDIRNALEYVLKDHWVNHQSAWEEHEKERLSRLRLFFNHLGRNDLYEEIFQTAEKVFTEFNKKRGTA